MHSQPKLDYQKKKFWDRYVVNVRENLNNNNNKETDAHKYNSYVKESLVRANQDMDIRYILIFCCDI